MATQWQPQRIGRKLLKSRRMLELLPKLLGDNQTFQIHKIPIIQFTETSAINSFSLNECEAKWGRIPEMIK
jgi:hypothetical protein